MVDLSYVSGVDLKQACWILLDMLTPHLLHLCCLWLGIGHTLSLQGGRGNGRGLVQGYEQSWRWVWLKGVGECSLSSDAFHLSAIPE